MYKVADEILGYTYGEQEVPTSAITLQQLENLKTSVGMTDQDEQYLRLAGEVLADQTAQVVEHWRGHIITSIPHLERHSRTPEGNAIPDYTSRSNLRFRQWILDTCLRAYNQDWLNYQSEIALRHTSRKKTQVDGVWSTAYVPLGDIIAFIAVINQTIKPYLGGRATRTPTWTECIAPGASPCNYRLLFGRASIWRLQEQRWSGDRKETI